MGKTFEEDWLHGRLPLQTAFLGAIFDLDGVLTDTSKLHAMAWKEIVDPFINVPFDLTVDYQKYIAGRPRIEGLKQLLASRDQVLDAHQLKQISDLKNLRYLALVDQHGVRVNVEMLSRVALYHAAGIKIAIATSSKNARAILQRANLVVPGVLVDGNDVENLKLNPKPAPDIFKYAANLLNVPYSECIVFEDSLDTISQLAPARGVFVEVP